tara:strand:+ start:8297 stop:10177 length:1881 start_codon:yes stop_codon:yes gene_type:complete
MVREVYEKGEQASSAPAVKEQPLGEFHLIGPPGCGKSTALATRWIPRAVERFGTSGVAVCSLTRAAATEIGSRGLDIPRERVGTLHSFARKALTDGLGVPELAQDATRLQEWNEGPAKARSSLQLSSGAPRLGDQPGATQDSSGRHVRAGEKWSSSGGTASGDDALALVETLRHRCVELEHWPQAVMPFWNAWCDWKIERQLFDFTDLIDKAVEYGSEPPTHDSQSIGCLIVDEAQDLSALEMKLVRQWGSMVPVLVLAGDPNQSIYGFRGADAHAFHDPKTFPAERTFYLRQSYRLPPAVQDYAEAFLSKASDAMPVEYKPRADAEVGVEIVKKRSSLCLSQPAELVDDIKAELKRYDSTFDMSPNDRVMVLATAAYMLKPLIQELRREGVPFWNPYKLSDGSWNPMRTAQSHFLSLFGPLREDMSPDDADPETRNWTWGELNRWLSSVTSKGLVRHGMKKICAEQAKKRAGQVLDGADLARVFADPAFVKNELLPMLADPAREREALSWYSSQLNAAKKKSLQYALNVAKHGVAQLRFDPRVIVGTVHSVKGGTAGTVYLAPDLSMASAKTMGKRAGRDALVHTFYVGMTRASRRLMLVAPSLAGQHGNRRPTRKARPVPHVAW